MATGVNAPTFGELAQALDIMTRARGSAPDSPHVTAAMCDIAESIGDGVMLQHCAEELEHKAPNYEPTKRVRRVHDGLCPPWRFWGGWITIAGALALTVGDAVRRFARKTAKTSAVAALGSGTLLALASSARAEEGRWLSEKFKINDRDPESSIPPEKELQSDPLQAGYMLQDLISKAEIASRKGDHAAAVKFYAAILKLVPNKAIGASRMCDEFEAMGNVVQATNACGLALGLQGVTTTEYAHFVHLVMRKEGALSKNEVAALKNVIDHVKQDPNGLVLGNELECQVAVRLGDVDRLKECAEALARVAPNDSTTLMYEWDLALRQHKYSAAEQLMTRAEAAGLKGESLERMRQATHQAQRQHTLMLGLTAAGGIILVACALFGLLKLRERRRGEPPPAAPAAAA
jgi:tetratricopeptide (TPR) repeat protein